MSMPGWYPDPGGRFGHYRFWDGQTWSAATSTNPADPPPQGTRPGGASDKRDPSQPLGAVPHPAPEPPGRGRRRRGGWVLALGAGVLVLALVGFFVLRGRNPAVVSGPLPSTAASEAATPTATEAAPSAPPSATEVPTAVPAPTGTRSLRTDSCPVGDPTSRQDHPQDGSIHGGGLSFPAPRGWPTPGPQLDVFSWAYDVGETDLNVQPRWYAGYAVGAVAVADGFEDPQSGAELALECTASSSDYSNVISRTDLVNEATTVEGHPAWTIRSEIRANDPRTTFEGDLVEVTVVDLDSPDALAFFWGSAPIGDADFIDRLDRTAAQLTVD